jgi:hypothetical protein
MRGLYTIIIDYKGGTYIEQVQAEDSTAALNNWIQTPHILSIPGLGFVSQQSLMHSINEADNQPVPLKDGKSLWCTSFIIRGALMLIHLVRTAQ